MSKILLYNGLIVNENNRFLGSIGIEGNKIVYVGKNVTDYKSAGYDISYDLTGMVVMPGVIDDQVHFREPGLTHKADIESESRAAVAGGVTSFMDMPNTKPQTTTLETLEWKNNKASEVSLANYGFFIGATNENTELLEQIDYSKTPGVKLFLGASTGNMLVDNEETLDKIFSLNAIIAIHSEDETIIRQNIDKYKRMYANCELPISLHPLIRNEEVCYESTRKAVERAKRFNTRLHVLHLSTEKELEFFSNLPLSEKRITAEVCVHHLWFTDADYELMGAKIKWNPAIKKERDRDALREALNNGLVDIVATDHAPHLWSEKKGDCLHAASGGPLIQHSLVAMLQMVNQGIFSLEKVTDLMSHRPAELFGIEKRGFIREGYYADIVIVKPHKWVVDKDNILSKCGWSPFEGTTFDFAIDKTFVNGNVVYDNGKFYDSIKGMRLNYKSPR